MGKASGFWCARRDLNPYVVDTRTSNVPVCQFQHSRITNAENYTISPTCCQGRILPEQAILFCGPVHRKTVFQHSERKKSNRRRPSAVSFLAFRKAIRSGCHCTA